MNDIRNPSCILCIQGAGLRPCCGEKTWWFPHCEQSPGQYDPHSDRQQPAHSECTVCNGAGMLDTVARMGESAKQAFISPFLE